MLSEDESLKLVSPSITTRIEDPTTYLGSIRGKALKQEFKKLIRGVQHGDELWEWEWWGPTEPRNRYSLGWCIIRNGEAVASYCHSYS